MKVILSRKGFDSAFGGYPSPILPSGEMISFPIPSYEDIGYSDVKTGESTYSNLMNLMKDLKPKIKSDGEWLDLNEETRCHLDPDIYRDSVAREFDWRPCFGQDGVAQSHLEKQGVRENDLFLYFGWFRKTVINNGKLKFDPREKGIHAIFGYLQIGEIKKVDNKFDIPKWLAYHPHVAEERRNVEPNKTKNTIYVARDNLSWNEAITGAGRFVYNDKLVLTKKGLSRSKWDLPDCFKEAKISYHNDNSRKGGYFQSAAIGQEFVISDNYRVEEWARDLIEGSESI